MKWLKRITALILACLLLAPNGAMEALAAETAEKEQPLIQYLVADPSVTAPGTQTVMLGVGEECGAVQSASLVYRNQETGERFEAAATEVSGGFALFQMEFASEGASGIYQLEQVSYAVNEKSYTANLAEIGIDAAFGVNQVAESEPDDVLLTDEELEELAEGTEVSVASVNPSGRSGGGLSVEQALEEAVRSVDGKGRAASAKAGGVDATGMSSLVVVLDPGHGGSDPGAQANGIVEKTVNLKIANYCKAELEQYAGVTVYMTRTGDTYLSLAQRAQVAIDKRADVFVSLHNNSNTSSGPKGANVYYPNSNYNPGCGSAGMSLARIIESKLTDLGLASGGIHIRNSENGTRYPDGSLADYYGVIKRCKENGIPGLIVEHAFISNPSDAKNYLSSDASLQRLGVADATGIAEYYGLSKGLGFHSIQSSSSTTMDLKWAEVSGVSGYQIYRSLSSGSNFQKVMTISSNKTTSWKDSGLEPGETYYYKIRTYTKKSGSNKYGKFSPVASGTTMVRPRISSVKSLSSKELEISWSTVNNASNYEIYRATKKSGPYSKIAEVAGLNRLNYIDSSVKAGKLYHYKIRSVGLVDNTVVYSDYSEVVSARSAKAPTGLSVISWGTTTLRVSWKPNANASGYVVQRASSPNGAYKKVGTVKGGEEDHFDDATVKAQTTYYYRVQSYNHNDKVKGYSGYGKAASGKTIPKTKITKLIGNSTTSQTISWKKVDGVDGYVIYQSTAKKGSYKKIKSLGAKKTSYKIENLEEGKRYFYKIRTRKKVNGKTGYGSYSVIRNAWSGEKVSLTAQPETATSIRISWNKVNGAESYDVYRSSSLTGIYKKVDSVKDGKLSYVDKDLKMTRTYYYRLDARIKGHNALGVTGLGMASGCAPINTTSIVSVVVNAQGKLQVNWNAVKGVTGYQIYRSTAQNGTYALLGAVSSADVTSFVDPSAAQNVVYYYKVVLVNEFEDSPIYGGYSPAASGILP